MEIETVSGDRWSIHIGDCRRGMELIGPESVHAIVTSPPYYKLRDYEEEGQVGCEPTLDEYIETQVAIFRDARRILRQDGVCFVNIGDTYEKGQQCLAPHRFAMAMQRDGWKLRSTVIWHKRSPIPESVSGWKWVQCRKSSKSPPCPGCNKCSETNGLVLRMGSWRPTTAHEYVFMFVKDGRYFCDGESGKEMAAGNRRHKMHDEYSQGKNQKLRQKHGVGFIDAVEMRNPRSVWTLSTESLKEKHFAAYPSMLVYSCLKAAISTGGCCSNCGRQYAPIVVSERKETRPGRDSKVLRDGQPHHKHSGVVGNRDPNRHTTISAVTGFMPTCNCVAEKSRPIVFDPYTGSGTTGRVALFMGARFVGCEISKKYACWIARKRLEEPWKPKEEKKPKKEKKPKLESPKAGTAISDDPSQLKLF